MEAPPKFRDPKIWSSPSITELDFEKNGKSADRKVLIEKYLDAKALWPKYGRLVVGQFDDSAILVYQGTIVKFCSI